MKVTNSYSALPGLGRFVWKGPGEAYTPEPIPACAPPLARHRGVGKPSPVDEFWRWPRKAATSPKALILLALRTQVRFARLRPPLKAPSTLTTPRLSVGAGAWWPKNADTRSTRNGLGQKMRVGVIITK